MFEGVSHSRPGAPTKLSLVDDSLQRIDFDVCPMCNAPDDLTDEHVPPKSVGGEVLTRTCRTCNSRFGELEESMKLRFMNQPRSARLSASSHPGRRHVTMQVVQLKDGTTFTTIDPLASDTDVPAMLQQSGNFEIEVSEAPASWYRMSLLKQSYLAACVSLREIPQSQSADVVRAELSAAVADRRAAGLGPRANELRSRIAPWAAGPVAGGVTPAVAAFDDERVDGFALAHFGFIEWPLSDVTAPWSS